MPGERHRYAVDTGRQVVDVDGERLACATARPAGDEVAGPVAVLLHGAGTGRTERLLPLARELAGRGVRVVAFDFSGHGDSTGELAELSLERRFRQACGVIGRLVPADAPLTLLGWSMSGQTVADLVTHYGDRVTALALCAPAVYARAAWPVRFGAGFTGIIRTPDTWRDSTALDAYRAFTGRALLALPARDDVIPPAVTEQVTAALTTRSRLTRHTVQDAPHQLGLWFSQHPSAVRAFADALLPG
ncbi:alpha/beta fold hydrolase [Streptomyces sp. SL13]|uniref:Alpha/beta fold hydrolase n=1 Tax=Streptantibioticus silvisoli TaxID=2705255 RepID=A0AA90H5H9_9ACTN|nr:alpha/beta fold hydrolase [Streptantibioticus silvisoli]MDI5972306.1 alpha/beta fold hydrolase [Streptantibioticus silvisoli]